MVRRMCLVLAFTILVSGVTVSQSPGTHGYYNKDFKVGFRYPANWELDSGKTSIDEETGFTVLATASLPEKSYARSNFNEAKATIEVGNVSAATCRRLPSDGESTKPRRKKFGNITFYTIGNAEGAAGSLYETELYRVFNSGRCYQVSLVVHTSNVLAHERGVRRVNSRIVFDRLYTILRTFYFGK